MKRNIIVGLDGATWDVIDKFIDRGVMPFLDSLRKGGVWGNLQSNIPPVTPSAWVSIITGYKPSKTGILGFTKKSSDSKNTYIREHINSTDINVPTMWDILSSYNKNVISVNVPMTFPPWNINGMMISGFMTPSEEAPFVYPESLKKEFADAGIDYRIDYQFHKKAEWLENNSGIMEEIENSIDSYISDLLDLLNKRMAAIEYLMEKKPWDYFMFVLVGMDRIQHHLWDLIEHNGSNENVYNKIEQYYSRVDDSLKKACEKYMQAGCNIVVVSDHGFNKLNGNYDLNHWLCKNGYLKRKQTDPLKILRKIANILRIDLRKSSEQLLGADVAKQAHLRSLSVNWKKTRAFSNEINSISLNLENRETMGIVEDSEYEDLIAELKMKLLEIKNSKGDKIIEDVFKTTDLYENPEKSDFPDILIKFRDDLLYSSPFRGYNNKKLFSRSSWKQGDHTINGIFIINGDSIVPGRRVDGMGLWDILPNILYLNNEKVPEGMDGEIKKDIYKEKFVQDNPVEYSGGADSLESKKRKYLYSEDDKKAVEERLKSLGYL